MRILVTGGAGYLGSILVPYLLSYSHDVTVLDNFMFGQDSLTGVCNNKYFHPVVGDARDSSLLESLVKSSDVIIPLAGIVGAPSCDLDRIAAKTTNVGAIRTLLKLVSKDQLIIYPTTNSGYGVGGDGLYCTEGTLLNPISLYGKNKVAAEGLIMSRENSISFRFATLFGMSPRMRLDLLVNFFVYKAVSEGTVVVFEASFKRNFLHVIDAARVIVHALGSYATHTGYSMRGEVYNVGLPDANLSKEELCNRIKKYVPNFLYICAPIGSDPDQRNYIVSNQKIMATGFTPAYSLDSGIVELIKGCQMLRNGRYGNV